ncbi:hypothetical protein PCL_03839 [Purpureocillium lilacinum]|uniref:Uncharacterized protein n=1 Tax=Purpureocillium lilacinum TaxID=33203 RepID=A0A2U3EQ78_PURLI|nr:hypothetical protein PCL_03839 [Purpureocillium lilacinum]
MASALMRNPQASLSSAADPCATPTSLPAMAHCPLQSTSSGALQQGVQSALGPSRRLPIVHRSRLTGALRTSRSQSDCKAPADHLGDGIREKGSVGRRSVGIGYSPLLHDVRDRMFVPFGRPSCSPHCHRQRSDGHVTRRATRREPWVRCPLFLVTPEASPTPPRLHPRAAAKDPRVGKGLSCNVESWNDQEPGPPHNGLTWDAVVQRRFSRVRVSKPPPIRPVHNAAQHTVDLVCTELGDTSRP